MFTRAQLTEYFEGTYTEQEVMAGVQAMADNGADFDPNGDAFDPDITEDLEIEMRKARLMVDEAIKRLPEGDRTNESLVVSEATRIAASSSSSVNPQMMAAMIRTVIESSVSEATALVQLRANVVKRVLTQGNMDITRSLRDEAQSNAKYLQKLANDGDRIDTLLTNYGIGDTAELVDAFLDEVKQSSATTKKNVLGARDAAKALQSSDDDFINAFLQEF